MTSQQSQRKQAQQATFTWTRGTSGVLKHKTPGQLFRASRSVPTKQSAPADENVWPVFAHAENHGQWGNNHSASLHFQDGQAVELLAQLMGSKLAIFPRWSGRQRRFVFAELARHLFEGP